MINEEQIFYSDSTLNVDRENLQLKNCVVFSTSINKNNEFEFISENLSEIVALGNAGEVKSYINHARGLIEKRVGSWIPGSFRIDGDFVKADLQLSEVNDVNPELKPEYNDFVLTLAEKEPTKCGFSTVMIVGTKDGEPSIKKLYSIDLVETPALTLAMFSKKEEMEMEEKETISENSIQETYTEKTVTEFSEEGMIEISEVKVETIEMSEKLIPAYEIFRELDKALYEKTDIEEIKARLIEAISLVVVESPIVEEVMSENSVQEKVTMESLVEMISKLTSEVSELKTLRLSENSKSEEKIVQFSVNSVEDDAVPEVNHMSVYSRLVSEGKSRDAASYHKANIAKGK